MTMDFLPTYDRRNRGPMYNTTKGDVLMVMYRIYIILFSHAEISVRAERGNRTYHNI